MTRFAVHKVPLQEMTGDFFCRFLFAASSKQQGVFDIFRGAIKNVLRQLMGSYFEWENKISGRAAFRREVLFGGFLINNKFAIHGF